MGAIIDPNCVFVSVQVCGDSASLIAAKRGLKEPKRGLKEPNRGFKEPKRGLKEPICRYPYEIYIS